MVTHSQSTCSNLSDCTHLHQAFIIIIYYYYYYYNYYFHFVTAYDDAGICITKVLATSHSLGTLMYYLLFFHPFPVLTEHQSARMSEIKNGGLDHSSKV